MGEIGADVQPIRTWISKLQDKPISTQLDNSLVPKASQKFVKKTFLLDNKEAAKIGRDAFLEPDILICPLSLFAPKTSNFFIIIIL